MFRFHSLDDSIFISNKTEHHYDYVIIIVTVGTHLVLLDVLTHIYSELHGKN